MTSKKADTPQVVPGDSDPPMTSALAEEEADRPREVSRHIPHPVQCMLWGKAGGRCEFSGCNKPLWKSSVTQEPVNIAQKAHIWAFSAGGPRFNPEIEDDEINSLSNLILVCHECHQKIDKAKDGGRYSAALLMSWKAVHERRIERVTAINPDKSSHVLLYGANIGDHSGPLSYQNAAAALFPDRYPAEDKPLELSMINSPFGDREKSFWRMEADNLHRRFNQSIKPRIAIGDLDHLSVFAFAPQPLLILFGTLLGDIVPADVYQLHREPPGWEWPENPLEQPFELQEPADTDGSAALVLGLSATVTHDRIRQVLGKNASIWTVTVADPHNDMMKSRRQLAELRRLLRGLLDRIKGHHGQSSELHIFPAAPVSAVVELGRVRMPKADMPWVIYDQSNDLGGFTISFEPDEFTKRDRP